MISICFVLGTRPEIIKLAPLIKLCEKKKINSTIIHTGQHFDYNMERRFFRDFSLKPKYFLKLNSSRSYNRNFIEKAVSKLIDYYKLLNPDYIINQGDTNSVLASALAYKKIRNRIKSKLVHVEAGIRSFDKTMPEEINRIKADKISDILFAPTIIAKKNLINERVIKKKIFVVGNTISDTIKQNFSKFKKKNNFEQFFFLTLHRPETVDNPKRLKTVIESIINLKEELKIKIIFPIHPRTKKKINNLKINNLNKLFIIKPCSYTESLRYQKKSKLVLTDSGGVQEEACILKTPCVTIRNNTERPETIKIKSNILTGYNAKLIKKAIYKMLKSKKSWENPYGKFVSNKILKILIKEYKNEN